MTTFTMPKSASLALLFVLAAFLLPATTHALPPVDPDDPAPPPPAATLSFVATPSTVEAGHASRLSWSSSYIDSCVIDQGVGAITPVASGYRDVTPSATVTYTITCAKTAGGSMSKTATVTVTQPPPPVTASCSASPNAVALNESVRWSGYGSGGTGDLTWQPSGSPYRAKVCSGGTNTSLIQQPTCPGGGSGTTDGSCTTEGYVCKNSGYSQSDCEAQISYGPNGEQYAPSTTFGDVQNYSCTATGAPSYSYTWSGTDGLSGSTQEVSKSYSSAGSKSGTVAITSVNGTASATCTAAVAAPPPAVTGCYQAGPVHTVCIDGLNNPGDTTCQATYDICSPTAASGSYYTNTGLDCLQGTMTPGGGVQHWPGYSFTRVDDSFCAVPGANLSASGITPASASATVAQTFSAVVTNSGSIATAASATRFQTATSATGAGAVTLSGDTATAGIAGQSSATVSRSHTFPSAGTFYMRACADGGSVITETNEADNCGPWSAVVVSAAPASVSCTVSPSSVVPNSPVTYTASPSGAATSPYTWTAADGATGFGSGSTATRSFSSAGSYGMQVRATGASTPANCPVVVVSSCPTAATVDITATPARVRQGDSTQLTWSASGIDAASCTVSGTDGFTTTVATNACNLPSAGATRSVSSQTTYTITCGPATKSVIVNVIPKIIEF